MKLYESPRIIGTRRAPVALVKAAKLKQELKGKPVLGDAAAELLDLCWEAVFPLFQKDIKK